MAKRNRNKYYEDSELSEITNHLGQAMGLRGNADSNYMTNLNKMAILEGNTMDNRKKQGLWDALNASTGVEGLSLDAILMRHLGKNSTDFQGGLKGEALIDAQKRKAELLADQEQQKVDKGKELSTLGKQLISGGTPKYVKQVGRPDENITIQRQGYSPDHMEGLARVYRTLGGDSINKNYDFSGKQGQALTDAKVDVFTSQGRMYKARTEGYKKITAADVKLLDQRTAEVLNKMELRGELNDEQIAAIKERVLIDWNQGFTKGLTEKKKRELLDQKIKTETEVLNTQKQRTKKVEKEVDTEKERTLKVKAEREQEELIFEKLPDKLKVEYEGLQKKNANLDATLKKIEAQEKDALSRAALNAHKRMKVQVEKDIARFLSKNKDAVNAAKVEVEKERKKVEELRQETEIARAGNFATSTYNKLMYPNKREGKGTTTTTTASNPLDKKRFMLDASGNSVEEAEEAEEGWGDQMPLIKALQKNPGDSSISQLLKILGIGGGSPKEVFPELPQATTQATTQTVPEKMGSPEEMKISVMKGLQGKNVKGWEKNQIDAFAKQVIAQTKGALTRDDALEILASVIPRSKTQGQ